MLRPWALFCETTVYIITMTQWGLTTKSHEQHQLTVSILEDDAYVMHDGRGVRVVKHQEKRSHLGVKETTLGNSVCVCVCGDMVLFRVLCAIRT